MANPCLQPNQSDFRGYPWEVFTETKTKQFQRNNCPSGQDGSWVSYSKTYTSYLSEDDLQFQIATDTFNFDAEGQANANSQGTCSTSCIVQNSVNTHYRWVSLSGSQIWLEDGLGRIRQPINKSTVLSGSSFSEGPLLRNGNVGGWLGWMSPYPYTNNNIAYKLSAINGNQYAIALTTVNLSTGNACTPIPSPSVILSAKTLGGFGVPDALCLSNGILFLVAYNYSGGQKSLDVVWHQFGGSTTIVHSIERPHNYKYYARQAVIAYNGSTAYIMASFASKNNAKRRRTAVFQVVFSGGVPNSVVQSTPFQYTNVATNPVAGCIAGSKLFFIYTEGTSSSSLTFKSYPVLGGSVSNPPNMNGLHSVIWDNSTPNVTTLGAGSSARKLFRYQSSTNTWETLN